MSDETTASSERALSQRILDTADQDIGPALRALGLTEERA